MFLQNTAASQTCRRFDSLDFQNAAVCKHDGRFTENTAASLDLPSFYSSYNQNMAALQDLPSFYLYDNQNADVCKHDGRFQSTRLND